MSHERLWPRYPEEVYVDVVEGELDQEFERDLEIWLKGSEGSESGVKEELESLSQLRQVLKDSDDVVVPESGLYYEVLEARIMGAVEQAIESGEVADRSRVVDMPVAVDLEDGLPLGARMARARGKAIKRGMASRAGQFAFLAGIALLMTGKWPLSIDGEASRTGVDLLKATRSAAPEVLADTVLSFESSSDLAIEIAARQNVANRMVAQNDR